MHACLYVRACYVCSCVCECLCVREGGGCIWICVCVCIVGNVYAHVYVHIFASMHVHARTFAPIYLCQCMDGHRSVGVSLEVRKCACMSAPVCVCDSKMCNLLYAQCLCLRLPPFCTCACTHMVAPVKNSSPCQPNRHLTLRTHISPTPPFRDLRHALDG